MDAKPLRGEIVGKVDGIFAGLSQDQKDEFVYGIVSEAARYFEGFEDDFCLQHAGSVVMIFGGTNRLIWSARQGFHPDKPYCTERFLRSFEERK